MGAGSVQKVLVLGEGGKGKEEGKGGRKEGGRREGKKEFV
jgi:hypothetical protein